MPVCGTSFHMPARTFLSRILSWSGGSILRECTCRGRRRGWRQAGRGCRRRHRSARLGRVGWICPCPWRRRGVQRWSPSWRRSGWAQKPFGRNSYPSGRSSRSPNSSCQLWYCLSVHNLRNCLIQTSALYIIQIVFILSFWSPLMHPIPLLNKKIKK